MLKQLERLFGRHVWPADLHCWSGGRADNGREFIADSVQDWLGKQGARAVFVAKASPQRNCYKERFNGSMEREVFARRRSTPCSRPRS